MIGSVTGSDIYAGIKMLRSQSRHLYVLVEGPSEYEFLTTHASDNIRLVNCHGCRNLDEAKSLALEASDDEVVAIRDRDWHGILTPEPSDPAVFLTELYDLDATIILRTDAGRRIAGVFSSSDMLTTWLTGTDFGDGIAAATSLASSIGMLRLANERSGLGLRTDRMAVHDPMFDLATCKVDRAELIAEAMRRSRGDNLPDNEAIAASLQAEFVLAHDPHRLCCGHDLGTALVALISKAWGGSTNGRDFVLKAIRAALSPPEFDSLTFVEPIEKWANSKNRSAWRSRANQSS